MNTNRVIYTIVIIIIITILDYYTSIITTNVYNIILYIIPSIVLIKPTY